MTEAITAEPRALARTLGPKFRLSGLLLLVLAAALSLGAMSRAHLSTTAGTTYWESPITRWLGVALAPCGVALVLALAAQVVGLVNRRESWTRTAWPVCWRLAALSLLAILLAEESSLLSNEFSSTGDANWPPGLMNPLRLETRLRLVPAAEGLFLIGLVLALRPRRYRHETPPTRWSHWIRTLFVGLGGLVIVAELMIIPFLILLAIEAVENAKLRPGEGKAGLLTNPPRPPMAPGLADRIDATIPMAVFAMLAALIAAGWLASSLRRAAARADEQEPRQGSQGALVVGLGLAIAVTSAGGLLACRALPAVQPIFLSGLKSTVSTWELAVVVLGFVGFSTGLVAHALAPGLGSDTPDGDGRSTGWNRRAFWMFKALAAAVLALVILTSLEEIKRLNPSTGRFLPGWLLGLSGPLSSSTRELWAWIKANGWLGMFQADASLWFPAVIIPWLAWKSAVLLISSGNPGPAPFDSLFDSAGRAQRFVGYSCALSALLLVAVPTLALTGLVVLQRAFVMAG